MKFLRVVGNIFWFIFIGLELWFCEIFYMILSVVTIIPIFFGCPKVHWTNSKYVVLPFGKKVDTHFGKAPFRNIVNLLFGGLYGGIASFLLGCIFFITIIGIPVGKVLFQIAKLEFAPFKAEIIKK